MSEKACYKGARENEREREREREKERERENCEVNLTLFY